LKIHVDDLYMFEKNIRDAFIVSSELVEKLEDLMEYTSNDLFENYYVDEYVKTCILLQLRDIVLRLYEILFYLKSASKLIDC